MIASTGTDTTTATVMWTNGPPPVTEPKPAPRIRRCIGRVGRKRCKCMSRDLWCHRHKAQQEAYFLRMNKPWSPAKTLEYLADRALLDWEMEDAEFDAEARTLTVKDWCGSVFVFTLTSHKRPKPFKERLKERLRHPTHHIGDGK